MDEKQAKALLEKYNNGTATPEERQQAETYFFRYLEKRDELPNSETLASRQAEIRASLLNRITAEDTQRHSKKWRWPRIAVAASISVALSAGSYFILHQTAKPRQIANQQTHDIAPGRNQATLTLANGQKIVLSKGLTGRLATQGNMLVSVSAGNAIIYTSSTDTKPAEEPIYYNTVSTVRGQESPYPLILADGTKAWLNAASSITFPTAFNGKERLVKITGEVYFKVAHNPAKPFKVNVNGQTIEDIGTSFNINSYTDEPATKTTLVEGSIRVSNSNNSVIIKPGQQASINAGSTSIHIGDADMEEALAWRNGIFVFNHENIRSIMRKVSRWYDVDIEYQDGVSDDWVGGSESRFKNVSEVLRKLELTGQFHFKIEGKKIIVTK